MQLDRSLMRAQRRANHMRTLLLLAGLMALALGLGWILAGTVGMIWAALVAAATLAAGSLVPAGAFLRLQGSRPLPRGQAPLLYQIVDDLSARAGLERAPSLNYQPGDSLAALTMASGQEASITLGQGLLRLLSPRELAAVLAHELSHVRSRDLRLMRLAAVAGQVTQFLALMGQVLLLLNLPVWLGGGHPLPWAPLLALMVAPWAASLMLMALSRTREYEADAEAAGITGDPLALAEALGKIEKGSRGLMQRLFRSGALPANPLFSTHPPTRERVARLMLMAGVSNGHPRPHSPRFVPPPGFGRSY